MIFFRRIKRRNVADWGHNAFADDTLGLINRPLSDVALKVVFHKNCRREVVAPIAELSVRIQRINRPQEQSQQARIRQNIGVIGDCDNLQMPGPAAQNVAVTGVGTFTTGKARNHLDHPLHPLEITLDTPEAPACHNSGADVFGVGLTIVQDQRRKDGHRQGENLYCVADGVSGHGGLRSVG